MRTESDELTHVYTLVVKPDNTFAVSIDGSEVEDGKLADGWKFLEPKEIDDPEDKKPSDWVDEAEMDDPEDKKPEGYDDIPARFLTPRPRSQTTVMMSLMASGKPLRSTTQISRASGRQSAS